MKIIKKLVVYCLAIVAFNACEEKEISYVLQDVSAPSNVQALFNISNDDTGTVSVTPTADGATSFQVYFGDTQDETPIDVSPGEEVTHIYPEGEYLLKIVAIGISGLTSELNRVVTLSFTPPTALQAAITISNDFDVAVTPTAENASVFDVYFGEVANGDPITIMAGEVADYTYAMPGDYTIRIVARGASATTIAYEEVVTISAPPSTTAADFAGTWALAAEAGSFGVGPAIGDISWFSLDEQGIMDRACFIDDKYVFGDDGSFRNVLGAQTWVETWQGVAEGCGAPVAPHNGAVGTYTYDDVAGTLTVNGLGAYIALSKGTNDGELMSPADAPSAITYRVSLSEDKNTMNVVLETSPGVFWQFKMVRQSPVPIVGTWKLAAEAGSFGVGPAIGDVSWFSLDEQGIMDRACLVDDLFTFGEDGTFTTDLGADTWIEGWQGGANACGTPVAPHDGATAATYAYDSAAGTVTLNGTGAYIALAKGTNDGELAAPANAPSSITYNVSLADDDNTMFVNIETGTGSGTYWQFKLVRYVPARIEGTWRVAAEAGSFGVGPAPGDTSWFSLDAQGVADRACFIDDKYVFGANGSFTNVLGSETWVEAWQGGNNACAAPVAPHNGSADATYVYDENAGTITLTGTGAYIALPKGTNGGELSDPSAAPASIVYNTTFVDDNTMNIVIETGTGSGTYWQFKLVKQ